MRRGNLWIIGVVTAIITVISLNAVFGPRHWRSYAGYHHRYYHDCDGYNKNDSTKANTHQYQKTDTTTAQY